MGRQKPTSAELKRQLVLQLDQARNDLSRESSLARVEWNPLAMARRSMQKHKAAWIAGGMLAGVVVIRLLMPPKFRSDNLSGSDKKRGVKGLIGGLLAQFARRAALNYASTHLRDYLQSYLESYLNRPGPDTGSDSSSHVASR